MLRSRAIRIAAFVLGGILALAAILVGVLHTPPARRYVLQQVVSALDKQGIVFSASSLDYNLFSLKVDLRDVRVQSKTAPLLPPLLLADHVAAKLSLRELLRGAYYIESAAIENPRVSVVIDRDGSDNLPHPPQSAPSSQPVDYLVRAGAITGGSIRYEDRRQQMVVLLPVGSVAVKGNAATRQHEIRLTIPGGGTVGFSGRTLPVGGVNADVVAGRDDANVRALRIDLGASSVNLSGEIESFSSPVFDVRADMALDSASLAEFAGVAQPVRGDLHLTLTAAGPLPQLRVSALLHGEELAVDRFDHLNLDAQAAYQAAASSVQVQAVRLNAPWGRVQGEGVVMLTPEAGQSRVALSAQALALERLCAIFRLPVRVASTGNVQAEANWPGLDYERAAGNASVRLEPSRGVAKDVVPVAAAISASARGSDVTLQVAELSALGARASGTVELANRKALSGQLEIEAPALASTVAGIETFLGNEGPPPAIDGALHSTAALSGTISAPEAAVNATIPNLHAGDLQDIAVTLAAVYNPQRVVVNEALIRWHEQRLRGSGEIGLAGATQPVTFTARTENLTAGATLAALGRGDVPVRGDFAISADVSGTVQNPVAAVRIDGSGLRAYGELLGTLEAQARYQDRRAELTRLRMEKPQPGGAGLVTASGSYETESGEFQARAQARDLRLLDVTLPDGATVRGEMGLDLTASGTAEQPTADLKLNAQGLQWDGRDLGSAELSAQVARAQAVLQASLPRFGVAVNAEAGTRTPSPFTAEVRLENTDLSRLPVEMSTPVEGSVSAVVKASGELENFDYRDAAATAQVSKLDVRWNGVKVGADGPLSASYRNRTLTVERANLVAEGSRVELSGRLPLDRTAGEGALDLRAQLDLPGLARLAKLEGNPVVQGNASIQGSVRGTLERLDPDLTLSLENGSFASEGLTPGVTAASLHGRIHDGALELESLSADWGAATLRASGTVPFALLPADLPVEIPRRQGAAQFTAALTGLTLASVPGVPEGASGTVTARVEAEAPKPELGAVRATLTFPELNLAYNTFKVEQKGESTIRLENGIATVERLQLTGPTTELNLTGTVDAQGEHALNLALDGSLDASVATLFAEGIRARGPTTIHAAVSGTAAQPKAQGFVEITGGQLAMDQPRIGADDLNVRIDLDGATATLAKLDGEVNGGKLTGSGSITMVSGKAPESDLGIKIADLYMDFPAGLKTVSDVNLQLRTVQDHPVLRGSVLVKQGGFTDDLFLDKGILASSTAPGAIGGDEEAERNQLLASTRFNIAVVTEEPIVVDNNLMRAQITTQIIVLGNPYELGLAGRLIIEEGAELTLQERKYNVQRGVITFTNDRRIEPNLDLLATTTVPNHDITLQVSGPPGKTETVLRADPELPEPDILALLVTGKTLDQIRGQEFEVAQSQVLSYLTGRVGSSLGRRLEGATGLSRVRIEPNLIAAETNPGARLTVGQDITPQFNLVYSMDLVNSSDQVYIAEYDLTKRFVTRSVRQEDGSWRFDFRHDLQFGGVSPPRRQSKREARRVSAVSITGQKFFTPQVIQDKLDVKAGDRYDFFKVRKGMDRVGKMYEKADLLEAGVRLRRQEAGQDVDLTLRVDPGPKVNLVYEGVSLPGGVRDEVRRVWRSGVFDTQRLEDASGVIREWLIRERYLTPQIATQILNPQPDEKRVVFDVQRGPRFENVEWVFDGARGVDPKRLRSVVEDQKLSTEVYTKPERVTDLLQQFYREMGYLDASLDKPRYQLEPEARTGKVIFPVQEGPLYHVGEAVFEGNQAIGTEELRKVVPLPEGAEYRPVLRDNSLLRLREAYWERGYNDVEIQAELQRTPAESRIDLRFRITENAQAIAREVVVEGNRDTSENLIRTQLAIRPGDPVNLEKLGDSRRKLYNTGAFSMVEIAREELPATDAKTQPVRLVVRVQEVQPFEVKYGGFFDTERGPGGIVDFSNRNSLGSARVLGFRGRYDSQWHEARVYFSQPLLSRFPLRTIASPYIRREINPETDLTSGFNVDRVGLSLQQEAQLQQRLVLNYGYRIERSHTYDTGPDPFFDVTLRVASLTSTLSRDTRDDVLDAATGSFFSSAIQYSPSLLGSQVRFIKYLGQYFRYFPLQKPKVELFTNKVLRPRLVYATGARVGLATGFGGQEVPVAERFFAGGGTTIRGFEQNSVGASLSTGLNLGGQGMIILNNELRFPIASATTGFAGIIDLDGAGFVDIGNVYPHVSDFSLTNLRKAAGPGLRLRTPWFLIRMDYGFILDRKPGESRGRIFFSIGQAF